MPGQGLGKGEFGMNFNGADHFDRHWRLWVTLFWLGTTAVFIAIRWDLIGWFALDAPDDNHRLMQVSALLDGQGWFYIRPYRLYPPNTYQKSDEQGKQVTARYELAGRHVIQKTTLYNYTK